MSGIGLKHNAIVGERDNAVQDPELFRTLHVFPKTSPNFQFEMLRKFRLVPIEIRLEAHCREIVAMHDDRYVAARMVEAAWTGGA